MLPLKAAASPDDVAGDSDQYASDDDQSSRCDGDGSIDSHARPLHDDDDMSTSDEEDVADYGSNSGLDRQQVEADEAMRHSLGVGPLSKKLQKNYDWLLDQLAEEDCRTFPGEQYADNLIESVRVRGEWIVLYFRQDPAERKTLELRTVKLPDKLKGWVGIECAGHIWGVVRFKDIGDISDKLWTFRDQHRVEPRNGRKGNQAILTELRRSGNKWKKVFGWAIKGVRLFDHPIRHNKPTWSSPQSVPLGPGWNKPFDPNSETSDTVTGPPTNVTVDDLLKVMRRDASEERPPPYEVVMKGPDAPKRSHLLAQQPRGKRNEHRTLYDLRVEGPNQRSGMLARCNQPLSHPSDKRLLEEIGIYDGLVPDEAQPTTDCWCRLFELKDKARKALCEYVDREQKSSTVDEWFADALMPVVALTVLRQFVELGIIKRGAPQIDICCGLCFGLLGSQADGTGGLALFADHESEKLELAQEMGAKGLPTWFDAENATSIQRLGAQMVFFADGEEFSMRFTPPCNGHTTCNNINNWLTTSVLGVHDLREARGLLIDFHTGCQPFCGLVSGSGRESSRSCSTTRTSKRAASVV